MAVQGGISQETLEGKKRIANARERLAESHSKGTPGPQISAALSSAAEDVILSLCESAADKLKLGSRLDDIAVVAHGGFGRRDLAPYSDVDVMLLTRSPRSEVVKGFARQISQDIFDCGLDLGFSTRTPRECRTLSWGDPVILTSLSESRFLFGNEDFFDHAFDRFGIAALRRHRRLIEAVRFARAEERSKWGETAYLLRPNVKRSRGGLRDIQLIRWVGFLKYGENDPAHLAQAGLLLEQDHANIKAAYQFLLRLRNQLHFMTNRAQDILDKPLQMEIAAQWGYQGQPGILPVEEFMQDYFRHVSNVRYASSNFVDAVRYRSLATVVADRVFAKPIDHEFFVGPHHIRVRPNSLPRVAEDVAAILRLMECASRLRKRIDNTTWQAIRTAMATRPPRLPDEVVARLFMQFMGRTGRLASLLRRLHELQVLEQIIPAMGHARNLLQFNEYHKYTVDTHTFRAIEAATEFEESECLAGRVYRKLKKPELLHLALLLHDLGKGYAEDHSEVGRRIALETGEILRLPPRDTELVATLIHKHLVMSNTAFRHDVNDPAIIAKFASQVGSQRLLDMLFLHTIADMTAVGPDVLTDWKRTWLDMLYRNTRVYFRSGSVSGDTGAADEHARIELRKALRTAEMDESVVAWADEVPSFAILGKDTETVVKEIQTALPVARGEQRAVAWGSYDADKQSCDYSVVSSQGAVKVGLFARIVSALSANNLEILRAEIETVFDDLAWDTFTVRDPDFDGPPPQHRIDEVCQAITTTIESPKIIRPQMRKTWGGNSIQSIKAEEIPPQVQIDNDTSDRFTIFSIFTYDRPGLLFEIAEVFTDENIDLQFAKIATHVDQVVDVFYVKDANNEQIHDDAIIQRLCDRLIAASSGASAQAAEESRP